MVPFFAFPLEIRRVIYTINAIESLHMRLRKIIKTCGHFPNDDAAIELLWLALRNVLAHKLRSTYVAASVLYSGSSRYGHHNNLKESCA
jgi:putative transposase